MTNTTWRLAGGIGHGDIELDRAQYMTQGLGYPLRPVDGVPNNNEGDLLEVLPIATGELTQWCGPYRSGLIYPTGSIVSDGNALYCAKQATVTKPAPVSTGNPQWMFPDTPLFVEQQNTSVVYSGHDITFNVAGVVRGLRAWVTELTADTNYRFHLADITDPLAPIYMVIEEPVLQEDQWVILQAAQIVVTPGARWRLFIDALNSGGDTSWDYGWTYAGSENSGAPAAGGWNHRTQQDIIRVSTTDLDGTSRVTELMGLIPNSILLCSETLRPERSFDYRVIGTTVNMGSYVEIPVELRNLGAGGAPEEGATTTLAATIPVAQSTKYAELAGGAPTPTWGTVTGILEYDGQDQGGSANGYGLDIYFDEAVINPEWDIMVLDT